jgi:lysozyme
MLGLIAAGASAPVLMAQFQHEKEGTSLTAYQDKSRGIWTICGGVTYVDGKPVIKGMKLTRAQCDKIDKAEQAKALAWVDRNVRAINGAAKSWNCFILSVEYWPR